MRQSMRKIFTNLEIYLILIVLLSLSTAFLIYEQSISFEKMNILKNEKKITNEILNLDNSDLMKSKIMLNTKSKYLLNNVELLKNKYQYNFSDKYLLSNEKEYFKDLNKLQSLTILFNNNAKKLHIDNQKNNIDILNKSFNEINIFIDQMIFKNIEYDEKKFNIINRSSMIIALLIMLITFWYRRKLGKIHQDILFLYSIDKDSNKDAYKVYTEEADAISLRMKRKSDIHQNPEMIDPVTSIYNYKGLTNAYANKKNLRDGNFVTVALLEVDSFSKTNRAYTQEATQAMLKKIAFTMSLHEQAVDIIARTEYNQFTMILSRGNKKQAYNDLDIIRQSISEIKFNTPNSGLVSISMSIGFIPKPTSITLEDAIKKAKEVLEHAKSKGGNIVSQPQDLIVVEK